jgi:hypothetical protein
MRSKRKARYKKIKKEEKLMEVQRQINSGVCRFTEI